jgi:hypothetical protein
MPQISISCSLMGGHDSSFSEALTSANSPVQRQTLAISCFKASALFWCVLPTRFLHQQTSSGLCLFAEMPHNLIKPISTEVTNSISPGFSVSCALWHPAKLLQGHSMSQALYKVTCNGDSNYSSNAHNFH